MLGDESYTSKCRRSSEAEHSPHKGKVRISKFLGGTNILVRKPGYRYNFGKVFWWRFLSTVNGGNIHAERMLNIFVFPIFCFIKKNSYFCVMNLLRYKGDVIVPIETVFSVCVLVVREDGKILGVTRKTDHNAWGLPGGKIDPGETAQEAIIREVKEETGLDLTYLQFHFVQDCVNINGMKPCAVFRAEVEGYIHHNEPHLVDWIDPKLVFQGPFSDFNQKTFSLLNFKF